jgi:long-subunit acyl-CoA synthetase (AMP-forming)
MALLDQRAARTPAGLAFTAPNERVDWREFADRVDGFALALEQLGIRPGDHVAVMGQTTGEWAIADLGISPRVAYPSVSSRSPAWAGGPHPQGL